ncbi:hypothetical protein IV203_009606 [Nitzschia inconspicua]|uniref:Uncharacterized protein n=1 Tax=Nitzschia inconspicua TaxID=303405 RepID=A0A9K3PKM7_9STRA|nr:hypothetical protein IV203_009606 [Nitzschia inconspicua]
MFFDFTNPIPDGGYANNNGWADLDSPSTSTHRKVRVKPRETMPQTVFLFTNPFASDRLVASVPTAPVPTAVPPAPPVTVSTTSSYGRGFGAQPKISASPLWTYLRRASGQRPGIKGPYASNNHPQPQGFEQNRITNTVRTPRTARKAKICWTAFS